MERLIEVARLLREKEGFGGYIHLKAIPGCGERLLRKAGLYADRLSANIELPTASSLTRLAPQKSAADILGAMRYMGEAEAESREDSRRLAGRGDAFRAAARFAPAGQSTQIVIGASAENDRTIVRLAGALYRRFGMRRVYYSAFVPVAPDPRLPSLSGPPLRREHRLYQADWLLRFYNFKVEEILEDDAADLSEDLDPKTAWALRHPDFFPLEIETADYAELLRAPGVGLTGAGRIVGARTAGRLRAEDLPKLGIAMKRAKWFLCLGGKPLYSLLDRVPSVTFDPDSLRVILADSPATVESASARTRRGSVARSQMEFEFA
jgi:putative DNA modification/repair radical SAM protein